MKNISPAFKYNKTDAGLIADLMLALPEKRIELFQKVADQLTDYAYWFVLSNLWVNDSRIAPIAVWKEMFSVKRASRDISLMKPDELKRLKELPNKLTVYRLHSKGETDWISYTLNIETAFAFSGIKGGGELVSYQLKKRDCLALFLRRGEAEIICLNKEWAKRKQDLSAFSSARNREEIGINGI